MVKKCDHCKKKKCIKLFSFKCKCGNTYCMKYQSYEKHKCKFNHIEENQKRLSNDNPVIEFEKVVKIT